MPGFNGLSPNLQGMALMLVSTAFGAGMHAAVKYASTDLHPLEIYFFRQLLALVVLGPIFFKIGWSALKTERLSQHAIRGLCMAIGGSAWFWSLSLVPLAKVSALQLSTALFTVAGAILFLKEKSEWRRWAVLLFGFAGVIVIVRPGFELLTFGVILVTGSRLFPAASRLISKVLSRTDTTPTIVVYGALFTSIFASVPAAFVWQTPTLDQLIFILGIATLGTLSQLCMVQAYKVGDMGAVEPFSFVRLIWAAIFGFILFAEIPEIWVWLGAAMIIFAVSYLAHGEAKKRPHDQSSM